MRLRSPAEFYIKCLLLDPDGYTTPEIRERLIDEDLDFISDEYINRLRKKLKPPKPFRPTDNLHLASYRFVMQERVKSYFQRTVPMKSAIELLSLPPAKEFAEGMLGTKVPRIAIAEQLMKGFDVYCPAESLDLYEHYFWNTKLLSRLQQQALTQHRWKALGKYVPEFKDSESLLKYARARDVRTLVAEMPYSPMTAMMAQMRLGTRPTRMDLALYASFGKDLAVQKSVEELCRDTPGSFARFEKLTAGAKNLDEILQTAARPEEAIKEQLRSVALRTDTRTMLPIHQVSSGNHTVDLLPPQPEVIDTVAETVEEEDYDADVEPRAESSGTGDG
jgi:hypothetical protein